jgi:hypothetical protein
MILMRVGAGARSTHGEMKFPDFIPSRLPDPEKKLRLHASQRLLPGCVQDLYGQAGVVKKQRPANLENTIAHQSTPGAFQTGDNPLTTLGRPAKESE